MKKLLIAILAVFATAAFAQEAFPDIPGGHWAGDAVERIADLGIVIGFPDGTYRGNESFTRYQTALVVSRLLDVIQTNMDASQALQDADIASLRNAIQELASDVAAQGVRLNAVEGAVASISDDVVSNTARLDALEATVAGHSHDMGDGGMSDAEKQEMMDAMAALQAQVDSARVAADTAAAQAAAAAAAAGGAADAANAAGAQAAAATDAANAAGAAAAGASDAAAAAGAQARQNAAAIDAINDLLALLNSDIEGMKADMAAMGDMMPEVDLSGVQGGIDRNASDIANIREFVILLRRDQVSLRDRVSALEAADVEQGAAIADLEARLAKVEEDLLIISGSIELEYLAARTSGTPFDVDRVWGEGQDRSIAGSNFSSGTNDIDDDDDTDEEGERAQDLQDIEREEGETDATLTLNVGFNTGRDGTGSPRALNSFSSVITLGLTEVGTTLNDTDGDAIDMPFVFFVDDWTTTFDPIGAEPLTFEFGTDVAAQFTPYILDTETSGYKATVGSPDFLAFLDPSLTIVYGELNDDSDATLEANDTYFRGVRGTLTPLSGDALSATGGFSYVESARSAGDINDNAGDNNTYTVWGVDGQVGVSVIDLAFEFANESDTAGAVDDSLFYVTADVDVASLGLPLLKSLDANFRQIPASWDATDVGFDGGDFDEDQNGFAVGAELGIFILDPLSFYFDSYSDAAGTNSVTAFGIDATINLFAAFAIEGFFHSAAINGTAVDNVEDGLDENNAVVVADLDRDPGGAYDTGFGVSLVHDGASADALIPGLDIEAGYEQTGADFDTTKIFVDADTSFTFGFITIDPYAGFESISDADAGTDDTTTIKAGTGLETDPLDIFLKPSLSAAVNFRNTDHTDADTYTATELQFGVGLTLNEFLFDNSTLTVKYGSYTGTNVEDDTVISTETDGASNISGGDENNGATQTTSGYEVVWDYYDLVFAYAAYDDDDGAGGVSAAQAFKISYKVTF